ncbi:hypothetical protein K431DRAFT_309714 [Polychaeton citri CBS 116435]|uniref:Non-structural maintenance of chromosomes element 1 homolog n=1 Tax=Polychaeton citri CBS 116435 TaxID=1314669 RepID=A0A9P4USI3_9PEZI|nr:hypothetical protein K431DRAFT_309714 [Polychaeton citri CBS 116435]
MPEANEDYNDTHRAFLQAILSRQVLTFEQARPLLAKIQTAQNPDRPVLENDISREDFEQHIEIINNVLSPLDYEIRTQLHQKTKDRIYALVNVSSDALTQMSTTYSADEIAFLKRVLDAIFLSKNTRRAEILAISGMQAIRLGKIPRDGGESQARAQDLTQMQAEQMLDSLVAQGWFEQSQHGFFSLSPRALMELRGWLIETYNDRDYTEDDDDGDSAEPHQKIKFCQACKDIVTEGQRCPTLTCEARLHNHCVRYMFRAQGGRELCPLCTVSWHDALPVGEGAARNARRSVNGTRG